MPNLNKVMLMGNLTRDVEIKTTPANQTVGNLGLAVNRKWRTPDGEDREEVTFFDCEAWGKTAEILCKYVTKGDPLYIDGRLKTDQWEDKDGGKRSKMKVVIENFQFLKGRDDGEKAREAPARQAAGPRPVAGRVNDGYGSVSADGLPF